jgi:hypothetical protein
VEVTPIWNCQSLLVWAWREFATSFIHNFTTSSHLIWRWPQIPWKSSLLIMFEKETSFEWGWSLAKNLPSGQSELGFNCKSGMS